MTLWEIQLREGVFGTFVPDLKLIDAAGAGGINTAGMRDAFRAAGADEVGLQLLKPSGMEVETERQELSDFLVWSWIPIFSLRARSLTVELGSDIDEFWPCRFQSNPEEDFFFHLPAKSFDIVDFEKSTFLMTIPGDPPMPLFIQTLKTKPLPVRLPPCFRAAVPRTRQVLGELFVRDDFKLAWERNGFTGAKFRKLT